MAELTVKGATWRNLSPQQVAAALDVLLAASSPSLSVEVVRPYEIRLAVSQWDLSVDGATLGLIQDVEAELKDTPRG